MPSREWRLRIEDILEAIAKMGRYTEGLDLERFRADDMAVDAVVRNLEVIGEAARNVPEDIRSQHPQIPWNKMCGMRNILTHEYFGISIPIIWRTVESDLPALVPILERMLEG